ncbi:MAG TPA: Arm DNA-binding domain-containing protein [Novosphingobium sp.]|nr:Arm DNA-binding domain-containing protein [Novosphingobium sp.]
MPKLTKTVVDKAEPRNRQYTVWCSDLKGFGVFVLPSGTRTYFVDYRNTNNVRRRMKLGRHGTITAEQARTLAIQALAEVAKGNDPLEDRNSARKAISVTELCELYIAELEAGRILGKGGRPKKASTSIRAATMGRFPIREVRRSIMACEKSIAVTIAPAPAAANASAPGPVATSSRRMPGLISARTTASSQNCAVNGSAEAI